MALGANERDVVRMVLIGAGALVAAGLLIGGLIAIWGERFAAHAVRSLSMDASVPIAVAAVQMIAVALVAAYLPAHRAARVDPVTALRATSVGRLCLLQIANGWIPG